MADDIKKVEVAITSTYDGKGAQQAAADQEKLTNTGKGLATTIPELDAATKAYTISTEAEYLSVQKAAEALRANIALREAAGAASAEQAARLKALEAALATEQAQSIAAEIENNKLAAASIADAEAALVEAAARREAAAAKVADAAASEASTAANEAQILMMRKAVTLFDEISRGQRGQLTATLGSLLKSGTLNLAELLPVAAVIAGIGTGINDWAKWLIKVNEEFQEVDKAADKSQEAIANILAAGGNVNDEFVDMARYMGQVAAQSDATAQMLRQMTVAAQEYDDATDEAAANASRTQQQQNDLASAQIDAAEKAGAITKPQADELRQQLELKKQLQEIDAPSLKTQQEIAKTQGEITNTGKDQAQLPSQTDAKAATDAAKHQEDRDAALVKGLPRVEASLDKESAESTKVANDALDFHSDHAWYNPLNWFDHMAHSMFGNDTAAMEANVGRQRAIAQDRDTAELAAMAARANLPTDAQAKTDAEALQKKTEALAKTVQELSDHLERLNVKLASQQADEAAQRRTATQAEAAKAAAGIFKSGETPQSVVAGVAAGNQQDLEYLNTILQAMGDDSKTRARLLEAIQKHTLDQRAEIGRVVQWLESVANQVSRVNNAANNHF
ncbi:MAG TPA: hypothetical protein VH280_17825 [Verrucomicrobiae bacterium]|jgi:hypothetical protein|nr:hypothetical protein [Verrucomicrobiae bacterium]